MKKLLFILLPAMAFAAQNIPTLRSDSVRIDAYQRDTCVKDNGASHGRIRYDSRGVLIRDTIPDSVRAAHQSDLSKHADTADSALKNAPLVHNVSYFYIPYSNSADLDSWGDSPLWLTTSPPYFKYATYWRGMFQGSWRGSETGIFGVENDYSPSTPYTSLDVMQLVAPNLKATQEAYFYFGKQTNENDSGDESRFTFHYDYLHSLANYLGIGFWFRKDFVRLYEGGYFAIDSSKELGKTATIYLTKDDSNCIRSRTTAEVLSDIGALPLHGTADTTIAADRARKLRATVNIGNVAFD